MKVNFNVQGKQRKQLVELIANYTRQKAEYQYTPTYAYKIGKYNVDRNGALIVPDDIDHDLLNYLDKSGFIFSETVQLNLTYPRRNFTDQSLENLRHLIWAKSQLIKDALSITSLPLTIDDQQISFNWFNQVDTDDALAYQQFIDKLVQYAQNHQRVMSQPREEINEKYAFRCFLLRLGFIGPEYKKQRKVLLKNLSGSAAFKSQES